MIESTWLRAFASFAEDANLSRAARRLHLSQPAVHAQIRRLGEELGVTLYRRAGRGLALTPQGLEVAAFARELDERTHDLVARLRDADREERVVLAAGAGAILYVIEDGLRAFTRARAARLEVLTMDAPAAVDAVRSGAAHVGVAALDARPEQLEARPLTVVQQVLVVPRGHRLAARRRVSVAALAGERLVLPPEGRPHRAMIEAAMRSRGADVTIGAVARGWELTLKLVEVGLGIAVVNGCCRVPRGLTARPVTDLPAVRYFAFTRPRPRPRVQELVDALAAHSDAWRRR
jgi:DNA-binding transcriptional LysR family regulator